jgi:hypothetical protein
MPFACSMGQARCLNIGKSGSNLAFYFCGLEFSIELSKSSQVLHGNSVSLYGGKKVNFFVSKSK